MKKYRYAKIREIVQDQIIETQEELAQALEREGIAVTQATISRDIKEMMLVKVPYRSGRYRYALSSEEPMLLAKNRLVDIFTHTIVKIEYSGNIVVIRTTPGSANAVAFALDNLELLHIIGTLAGDDTILLVVEEGYAAADIKAEIYQIFHED